MPLTPNSRLGPYEILAPLGAGGMGEVYKARDTRLGRTVAIKTSQARFTERFEREARAVAALSHPNICTLYDVGPDYLVMEYIDGKPLKGPLPVDTALRYAREIAAALDAAHRLNIIHRDLKPGNILVTKAGIKLLDFGLAKIGGVTPASDETVTKALTEEGSIIGTLQYMSPEQLEGKDADARSDIFSFGCVLHEMLSGHAAFEGASKASIIAAIMEREPQPLTGVSPALARAIQRCMAKDPDDRWQSARDLAGVLDLASSAVPESVPTPEPRPSARKAIAALALIVGLGVAAFAAGWYFTRPPAQVRWSGGPLGGPANAMGPRVSPDGHTIAFQAMIDGQSQVAVLKPETGNWTVLTHQKALGQITELAWSRDGSKIYFDRETDMPGGVYSIPVLGGEPRMVLELAADPQVLADGSLAVVRVNAHRDFQVHRFWPESGKVEPLPALADPNLAPSAVRSAPDGKRIIFYGTRPGAAGDSPEKGLFVMDIDGSHTRRLAPEVRFPTNLSLSAAQLGIAFTGATDSRSVILSVPSGSLYRLLDVPLDGGAAPRTLFTLSRPAWYLDVAPDGVIYADQVWGAQSVLRFPHAGGAPERLTGAYSQVIAPIAVLRDGRPLVHTSSGDARRFAIVEKDGTLSPLLESNEFCGPPATLVGDRHVAVMTDRKGEIAVVSIADGRIVSRVRLKHDRINALAASPDGKTFYYTAAGSVWSMPAAGGDPVKLAPGESVAADPNGRDLIVALTDKESVGLTRVPVAGGAPQPIAVQGDVRIPAANLTSGAVAPDGRIVVSTASASRWAYSISVVDPRLGTIAPVPHTFDGEVAMPTWSPDGRIVASGRDYNFTLWRFRGSVQ